jgi:hypothetical protein
VAPGGALLVAEHGGEAVHRSSVQPSMNLASRVLLCLATAKTGHAPKPTGTAMRPDFARRLATAAGLKPATGVGLEPATGVAAEHPMWRFVRLDD